jgi:NAD(P)-dependent dehydrogenase (short-subunit alcohol dehydrogenase family)
MTRRVALVTGGGTGIGRATARELGEQGWSVAVSGRREDKLLEAIAPLAGEGLAVPGDVTVESDARAMVERTVETFGRLDLLVNNAAIYGASAQIEDDVDDWRRQLEVNLHAPWLLCRLAYPHLRDSGSGVVVNVLSTLGHRAMAGLSAYCTSKAALDMLGRCLALEWAPDGIRVNSVSPGVVDTPIHEPGAAASMAEAHPLGRIGRPEEVALAIAFLASTNSAWTTGTNLDVDGGIRLA